MVKTMSDYPRLVRRATDEQLARETLWLREDLRAQLRDRRRVLARLEGFIAYLDDPETGGGDQEWEAWKDVTRQWAVAEQASDLRCIAASEANLATIPHIPAPTTT